MNKSTARLVAAACFVLVVGGIAYRVQGQHGANADYLATASKTIAPTYNPNDGCGPRNPSDPIWVECEHPTPTSRPTPTSFQYNYPTEVPSIIPSPTPTPSHLPTPKDTPVPTLPPRTPIPASPPVISIPPAPSPTPYVQPTIAATLTATLPTSTSTISPLTPAPTSPVVLPTISSTPTAWDNAYAYRGDSVKPNGPATRVVNNVKNFFKNFFGF